MITDIAGRTVNVGDVVAYAAASRGATWTRLYVVHSIKINIEDRSDCSIDAATGKWIYSEPKPTEIVSVCLRGFKLSWYDQQMGRLVKTYVRAIYNPNSMVRIDTLDHLDPNEPLDVAVIEWVKKQSPRNSWPFPTDLPRPI
jgi:hypothetical protein